MIMETDESFSFDKKNSIDSSNPKVQEWENLMWKYQQAIPKANPGEKWVLMKNIFKL
jgi:L-rhamnose mutarotase